jgi:ribonuclease HI
MVTGRPTVRALELALARRDEASIPGGYDAVLHADFIEIGSSGRLWTRDDTLDLLRRAARSDAVEIQASAVDELATGALIHRFDTVIHDPARGREIRTRRCSIWLDHDGRLQLRFHQGTPVPGPPSR